MRGKRSKAYRKLMNFYQLTFGFREPYQVLVDSNMVIDTDKCKMELLPALKRTLQGELKPMMTQCSIRHLYTHKPPLPPSVIDFAKTFERRRCNHHTLEQPLSERECLESVVIHNGQNKHRYVVAAQDPEVRGMLREIPGVPLVYVKRSVMIMEPMAEVSAEVKEEAERSKFRVGLKEKKGVKRKREEKEGEGEGAGEGAEKTEEEEKKKKRKRGPKGPNPLSIKKKKPKDSGESKSNSKSEHDGPKRKRKRKNAGASSEGGSATVEAGNTD